MSAPWRHPEEAGVVRCSRTRTTQYGVYRDAVTQFLDTLPGAGDGPGNHQPPLAHHAQVWLCVNLEQSLTRTSRRMPAGDGTTEEPSRSCTPKSIPRLPGRRVNGAFWHRTQDRAGIAFVSNGSRKIIRYIWPMRARFFAGRWRLTYGRRTSLKRITRRTSGENLYCAGVQHINDPGYNRDRGRWWCRRCGRTWSSRTAVSYQLSVVSEMH